MYWFRKLNVPGNGSLPSGTAGSKNSNSVTRSQFQGKQMPSIILILGGMGFTVLSFYPPECSAQWELNIAC